jgi:hypothetical protein
VGVFRKPPVFIKPGDQISVTVEGIGTLTNPVVGPWGAVSVVATRGRKVQRGRDPRFRGFSVQGCSLDLNKLGPVHALRICYLAKQYAEGFTERWTGLWID